MGENGMGEGGSVTSTFLKRMARERREGSQVRLQPRLPVRLPVVVEPNGPPAEMRIAGETGNLSRGGALLRLAQAPRPGTALRVTFNLRRSVALTITGTVVWTTPAPDPPGWKLGFQFGEELPEAIVAQIAEDAFPPGGVRSQ